MRRISVGGMSRPAPLVKKVPPPAVPEVFRHSGSSFGSAGYSSSGEDGCFLGTVEPHPVRDGCDHTEVYSMAGKSPGGQFSYPAFTFPGPQGVQYTQMMLAGKGSTYYHHQLSLQEDQGIDMTQSPGRDSPGSSGSGSGSGSGSRHSTASLDSGRASGYHLLGPTRGSGSGSGMSSSPRCSLSSSSLGSSDHGAVRAERLLQQGVPDQDVLHAWLMDLHFEEYFPLFASAGYDMPTICRMTPEDLTAIGIKKPNHRKKLKAEIAQLNICDGLPDYIPGSLEEWLRLLRLEEYGPALVQQGYHMVEDVTQLTWEDLEDIGIVKLGHQKKIMLAIKRVKDVRAGKRFPVNIQHADVIVSQIRGGRGKSLESLEDGSVERTHHTFSAENTQTFYYQHQVGGWRPRSYDDGDITPTNEAIALHEGGGTLPRPRGLVRPRPVAKIIAKTRQDFAVQEFEKPPAPAINYCGTYKSSPREMIDISKYNLENYSYRGDMPPPQKGNESPRCTPKKRPPSPPKRQSSRGEADIVIDCSGPIPTASDGRNMSTVTVDLHSSAPSPLLPLPSYPSSDALDSGDDLPLPPPPAPSSPPLREKFDGLSSPSLPPILTRSWGVGSASAGDLQSASAVEQELIASLALQQSRNGSDASFKSSSSTESDSLPFANENAGTIKQRTARPHPTLSTMDYPQTEFVPPLRSQHSATDLASSQKALRERAAGQEPADVLNDIGNMLANLTDELDAMLEEEKRQGLNQ